MNLCYLEVSIATRPCKYVNDLIAVSQRETECTNKGVS